MTAAWRVARAPGLLLVAAAVQLLLAAAVGTTVRSSVGAGAGPFALASDGGLLFALLETFVEHPAIGAAYRQLLVGSSLVALGGWTLVMGGVLRRLTGPLPAPEMLAAALRGFPGVAVTTLWHLVPRALLLAGCGLATAKLARAGSEWSLAALVGTVLVIAVSTCGLDLSRAQIVLHGARCFHPWTALDGYRQALRRWDVLVPSVLFSLLQWACAVTVVVVAIAGLGKPWTLWAARALALLAVFFGLARLAVAAGAGPLASRKVAARQEG